MASVTGAYMVKYRHKLKKRGRKRKNKIAARGSTPSRAKFFGDAK
jgi:hypothetical protein